MNKRKGAIQFDEELLKTLSKQENSGVVVKQQIHHLLLQPLHLNNIEQSFRDLINLGIPKYNKDLGGLLLGYENVKLVKKTGAIVDDSCGIHTDVKAKFFVFQPEINAEMQGIVNRKSKDHIGVLVYKSFNVSCPKPRDESDQWLGNSVNMGDEVKFSITMIDFNSYLPYIRGNLISVVAKNSNLPKALNTKIKFDITDDGDIETEKVPKKKKKKKHDLLDSTIEELISSTLQEKKSKKRKKNDESNLNEELVQSEEVPKKKRKTKKDEELQNKSLDKASLIQSIIEEMGM